MNTLCLIPARAGSVRLPQKNIKELRGKPLLAYTIECARQVSSVNRIVVSTNSEEIRQIALKHRAEVPFLRPEEISTADSTDYQFCFHAIDWFHKNENYQPDLVVLLRPTAPFRKPSSVEKAIQLLLNDSLADSVRSVKRCSEHPHKMWTIQGNRLHSLIPPEQKLPEAHTLSYHLLPTVYVQNANIDVMWTKTILAKHSITGSQIIPLLMDDKESLDINKPSDFLLAEQLFNVAE